MNTPYSRPDRLRLITLEKPKAAQISQIGELAEEAFLRFGHYRDFISGLVKDRGVVTAIIVDAEKSDEILGFILLGFIPVGGEFIADILAIALKEGYRGLGIGRRLMDWSFDLVNRFALSKVVKELRLTVAPDNERAVKLFKRYGFVFEKGPQLGTYPSGVQAVYMKVYFSDELDEQ